jgi:hypothetical protein
MFIGVQRRLETNLLAPQTTHADLKQTAISLGLRISSHLELK